MEHFIQVSPPVVVVADAPIVPFRLSVKLGVAAVAPLPPEPDDDPLFEPEASSDLAQWKIAPLNRSRALIMRRRSEITEINLFILPPMVYGKPKINSSKRFQSVDERSNRFLRVCQSPLLGVGEIEKAMRAIVPP